MADSFRRNNAMTRKRLVLGSVLIAIGGGGVSLWQIPDGNKSAASSPASKPSANPVVPDPRQRTLDMRVGVETLRNPHWYAEQGLDGEVRKFWDKQEWERILRGWADERYNAVI